MRRWLAIVVAFGLLGFIALAQNVGPDPNGYLLPNGWRISPVGDVIRTEDLILRISMAPDGRSVVALHSGFNPHGLVVIDADSREVVQRVPIPSSWYGLAWSPKGDRLFVSGGGCCRDPHKGPSPAPIWVFSYDSGKLSEKPVAQWTDGRSAEATYWSALVHHPHENRLYAADRNSNLITVFDTTSGRPIASVPTERQPYDLLLTPDGSRLYVSNMSSDTIFALDAATLESVASVRVGGNNGEMALSPDGRLFVACSKDNTVVVLDAATLRIRETIDTSLYPHSPPGTTPNALALGPDGRTLFVANADNNNVAVVDVSKPGMSFVRGFLPSGWYPSALLLDARRGRLYVGNSKGVASSPTARGQGLVAAPPVLGRRERDAPQKPAGAGTRPYGSVHTLTKGAVAIVDLGRELPRLREHTQRAMDNVPYTAERLTRAVAKPAPSIVPDRVGAGSPIRHVLYIIKENRTYDQVLGDLPQGDGDPALTIFGREITPNQHKIAQEFVLFDNLYTDGEVSSDGHQWSTAAYASDFLEKSWPSSYSRVASEETGYRSAASESPRYIWDEVLRKGLTLRMYGDDCCFTGRVTGRLRPFFAPDYGSWKARDYENARTFLKDFEQWNSEYDSTDPGRRMPNFTLMMLPEDHTYGTSPGRPTPVACVASNDWAVGMIVDRISRSRYWKETAIFIIEDDAQEGPDHVDARRTTGFVISPWVKRRTVDHTLYTTSSMLRTMELLLGLQPLSQYDAAAHPMYAAFSDQVDLTPFTHEKPRVNVDQFNQAAAWGAQDSLAMDFSEVDRTPMFELNEIVWKSIRGPDSQMPAPRSRFHRALRTQRLPQ